MCPAGKRSVRLGVADGACLRHWRAGPDRRHLSQALAPLRPWGCHPPTLHLSFLLHKMGPGSPSFRAVDEAVQGMTMAYSKCSVNVGCLLLR